MPSQAGEPLGRGRELLLVVLARLLRRDDRDLVVELAVLVDGDAALAVGQGVAVQLRRQRLARQLAEALAQLLLALDVEVLVAEEDNAALRDYLPFVSVLTRSWWSRRVELPLGSTKDAAGQKGGETH